MKLTPSKIPESLKFIHVLTYLNLPIPCHFIRNTFILIFFKFIYLFSEREREWTQAGEGQREGEIERIPSRPHAFSAEPDVGLNPINR